MNMAPCGLPCRFPREDGAHTSASSSPSQSLAMPSALRFHSRFVRNE
jgi:hypothetical protein